MDLMLDLTPDLEGTASFAWADDRFGTIDQQLDGLQAELGRRRGWLGRRRGRRDPCPPPPPAAAC